MAAILLISVLTLVLYLLLCVAASFCFCGALRMISWRWLACGATYVGLGQLAVFLPTWSALRFDEWNWQGKMLQTVLALSAAAFIGVKGVFGPGKWRSWCTRQSLCWFASIIALALVSNLFFLAEVAGCHRLAFQLTMPGLAEEAFYRGSAVALTYRALSSRANPRATIFSYGIAQTLFCFTHTVFPVDGSLVVDLSAVVAPAVVGVLLCGLRWSSRSVWPAVVAHNLFNSA